MLDARAGGVMSNRIGSASRENRSHFAASAMLAAFLTFALAFGLGTIGFLVGSILFLGPPILICTIALERLTFVDGWARAKELARGEGLRIFMYLLCLALLVVLLELTLIQLAASSLNSLSTETLVVFYYPLFGVVIGAGQGLMSAFVVQAYLDARMRYDEVGLDDLVALIEKEEEENEGEPDEA